MYVVSDKFDARDQYLMTNFERGFNIVFFLSAISLCIYYAIKWRMGTRLIVTLFERMARDAQQHPKSFVLAYFFVLALVLITLI